MSIIIKNNQFHLKTKNTSYIFSLYKNRWLTHLYWGSAIDQDTDIEYIPDEFIFSRANAFHVPTDNTNSMFLTDLKLEFSTVGSGDYRIPTFMAQYKDGSSVTEFEYCGYKIYDGKPVLRGLPATYSENDAQTLEITLEDKYTGLRATLVYSVFEEYDVITRNIRYENNGFETILLKTCMSATVDFCGTDKKVLNLYGDWAQERNMEWREVGHSITEIDSKRGMSSHMRNPFIAIADKTADENSGDVYAMSLVYSGSFSASTEGSFAGGTRMNIGINPFDFGWELKSKEDFVTPEAVLVYSDCGLGKMSRIYHKIYRERLCRGKFRDAERPTIINNWDATVFDFDEERLVEIAKRGAEAGIEMFVLDDGWFGKRNDDHSSLGDWTVNLEKLPNGLGSLAGKINDLGMKFGLWVEPEMISPDSELYRNHPDWCIHAKGRRRTENRYQLVLDISRSEVREYITNILTEILKSANIEYIKWDCNRNITETQNTEQRHRFILGLYEILETLTQRFPNVLFESCSGGGGRFDTGMLYYMPQVWTSDNMNPISRINIQYGTSLVYPSITMAAHVGGIDVGYERKNKYMEFCAHVAMAGNFGYEIDLSRFSQTELEQAKDYVKLYKDIRRTIQFGELYRVENPFENDYASWYFKDDEQIILFAYQLKPQTNGEERRIKLCGAEKNAQYEMNGKVYQGEVLQKVGFGIGLSMENLDSKMYIFKKI